MRNRCRFRGLDMPFALLVNRICEEGWRIFVLPCLKLHHFFSFEHKM